MGLMVKKAVKVSTLMCRPTKSIHRATYRRGFSLIEVLVVLAIFALSTSLIMPSMSRMLDQTMSHAVFFEFQRQVSDLRREASRTGLGLRVESPEVDVNGRAQELLPPIGPEPESPDDESVRVLQLREPWTYSLTPALQIEAGGRCSAASANLIHNGRVVMSLRTVDGTCSFIRYQDDAPKSEAR